LKSGIPGLEGLFSNDGSGNFVVGFSKMSDEDKKRFLAAVTGSGEKKNIVNPISGKIKLSY